MVTRILFFTTVLFLATLFLNAQENLKLWYNNPAQVWVEALPVGNGRLGAMVFGRVDEELIQLNESTLWSGGPVSKSVNPTASSHLPAIRDALLKEEDYSKAEVLTSSWLDVALITGRSWLLSASFKLICLGSLAVMRMIISCSGWEAKISLW